MEHIVLEDPSVLEAITFVKGGKIDSFEFGERRCPHQERPRGGPCAPASPEPLAG